jgi:hypothetical protein
MVDLANSSNDGVRELVVECFDGARIFCDNRPSCAKPSIRKIDAKSERGSPKEFASIPYALARTIKLT